MDKLWVGIGVLLIAIFLAGCVNEITAVPVNNSAPAKVIAKTTETKTQEQPAPPVQTQPAENKYTSDDSVFDLKEDGCKDNNYRMDPYTKGIASFRSGNLSIIKHSDCITEDTVRMWYCNKGSIDKKILYCQNKCQDGACVQ